MADDEFETFIEQVPLDEDGNVKYPEFMAQFDTKWVFFIGLLHGRELHTLIVMLSIMEI